MQSTMIKILYIGYTYRLIKTRILLNIYLKVIINLAIITAVPKCPGLVKVQSLNLEFLGHLFRWGGG